MKLKLSLSFLLVLFFTIAFGQPKKVVVKNGVWTFTQYSPHIIKVSFLPRGYTTNENISDAVITKPLQQITIPIKVENDIVYINKKIKIAAPIKANGFNSFNITLTDSEKVFGGGERALPLNRRGYKFDLYNSPHYGYGENTENLNYSVPFFTTSEGYGLFFDNASKGYADIGKTNSNIFEAGFVSGELNVYVILGKDYKEILSSYYKLTGTQPLPPRWALGNFMSRFGYSSEAQTKAILDSMHKQDIPVDAIIFDLFWFGDSIKSTMGNLAWVNKTRWPQPKQMIADFRKQNINTILITEPFVLESSSNYNNSKQYHAVDSAGKPFMLTNFYFGRGGLLDIFRNDTKQWFWSKYKEQMNNGVEGWWGDLGEPETHPSTMYHNLRDLGFKRLFKADEVHNMYGHTWTKMIYTQYAKEYPNKRLFSLNRSGFAGSQRYGIFPWTGDVSRSWSGLRAQLPVILGMSMSGVPYVHSDAGGFAGGDGDNELYVRWLQFAAFTPIFKPHGTALDDLDKNAFSFPSEAALIKEPYRTYAKAAIKLRYQLLPYNYTLAYKQTKNGEPLIAPLYYYYPTDTAAGKIEDEFMWGENILVAPILNKSQSERQVYLPKGKWYHLLYPKDRFEGNRFLQQIVDDSDMLIYVKEGSVIPLWKPSAAIHSTNDYLKQQGLCFNYFPSDKKSTGILYNDDGVSKKAISEIITFDAVTKGDTISIHLKTNNKALYKNGKTKKIKIGVPLYIYPKSAIKINGKAIPYNVTKDADFYYIEIEFKGEPIQLRAKVETYESIQARWHDLP